MSSICPDRISPFGGSSRSSAEATVDFPQPELAHDPDDLAGLDLEIDVVERLERPPVGVVGDFQTFDFEQRRHHTLREPVSRGSRMSRSVSPNSVKPRVAIIKVSEAARTGQ